jgi:hypothetical protein
MSSPARRRVGLREGLRQADFDSLSGHPETGKLFDRAMAGVRGRGTEAELEPYDFTGIRTPADIGGGNGSVLRAILRRCPAMQGILFDLPGVVGRAEAGIEAAGPEGRCRALAGNFFATMVPPGGMERTEEEYRQLLEAAGSRPAGMVPTGTWVSVIEGRPFSLPYSFAASDTQISSRLLRANTWRFA